MVNLMSLTEIKFLESQGSIKANIRSKIRKRTKLKLDKFNDTNYQNTLRNQVLGTLKSMPKEFQLELINGLIANLYPREVQNLTSNIQGKLNNSQKLFNMASQDLKLKNSIIEKSASRKIKSKINELSFMEFNSLLDRIDITSHNKESIQKNLESIIVDMIHKRKVNSDIYFIKLNNKRIKAFEKIRDSNAKIQIKDILKETKCSRYFLEELICRGTIFSENMNLDRYKDKFKRMIWKTKLEFNPEKFKIILIEIKSLDINSYVTINPEYKNIATPQDLISS